jgi:plasmid stability protein
MQEKQKVTLYLPPELHRQLKIRAAVDSDSMSAMVKRAIAFYLSHSEMVEQGESAHGKTHQVHSCPECHSSLVMRDGELHSLSDQPSLRDEEFPLNVRESSQVRFPVERSDGSAESEALVPC